MNAARLGVATSLVLATALSAGCATLTVDVDVYKGPLTNADEIRLDQIAAMAVAARPILYDLRYDSEEAWAVSCAESKVAAVSVPTTALRERELEKCRQKSRLLREPRWQFEPLPDANELQSSYARTIEGLISLYTTRSEPPENIRQILAPVIRALEKAETSMLDADRAARSLVADQPSPNWRETFFFNDAAGKKDVATQGAFEEKAWCKEERRAGWPETLSEQWVKNQALRSVPDHAEPPAAEIERQRRRLCVLDVKSVLASHRSLGRDVYELARGTWAKPIGDFCERTERTASARAGRIDRGDVVCAVHRAISDNEAAFFAVIAVLGDEGRRSVLDQARVESLANVAAALVSPRALRVLGADVKGSQALSALYTRLFGNVDANRVLSVRDDYEPMRQLIAATLADPTRDGGSVSGVLAARAFAKFLPESRRLLNDELGFLTFPLPDPSVADTQADGVRANLALFAAQIRSEGVGLHRGGPEIGIADAVDRYARSGGNGGLDGGEERALRRSLMYFAQKVLTLGDTSVLREEPGKNGPRNGNYVRILQALGNSILSNLNELVEKANADKREPMRVESLVAVTEHVRKLPPPVTHEIFRIEVQDSKKLDGVRRAAFLKVLDVAIGDVIELRKSLTNVDAQMEALRKSVKSDIAGRTAILACVDSVSASKGNPMGGSTSFGDANAKSAVETLLAACSPALETSQKELFLAKIQPGQTQPLAAWVASARAEIEKDLDADRARSAKLDDEAVEWARIGALLPTLPDTLPFDPPNIDRARVKRAADVWDEIDNSLKYLHVLHVARHGDSAYVGRIKDAQNLVARYRSGTMYLRAATSFLRNSYPAATLQRDTDYKNLLIPDVFRSSGKGQERLQREVDKQFWQSVNRVVVKGGGKVNYVVTKDDIGNWYVKGYSADSKRIAESMKGLALFAANPTTRASLAPAAKMAEKAGDGSTTTATAVADAANKKPTPTEDERRFEGFQASYKKQAQDLFKQLQAEAKAHGTTLLAALKRVHAGAKPAVTDLLSKEDVSVQNEYAREEKRARLLKEDPDPDKVNETAGDFNGWTNELLELLADYTERRLTALRAAPVDEFASEEIPSVSADRLAKEQELLPRLTKTKTGRKVREAERVEREAARNRAQAELDDIDGAIKEAADYSPGRETNDKVDSLKRDRERAVKDVVRLSKETRLLQDQIEADFRTEDEIETQLTEISASKTATLALASEVRAKAAAQKERDLRAVEEATNALVERYLVQRASAIASHRRAMDVLGGKTGAF
jgi:hypothetical protein